MCDVDATDWAERLLYLEMARARADRETSIGERQGPPRLDHATPTSALEA